MNNAERAYIRENLNKALENLILLTDMTSDLPANSKQKIETIITRLDYYIDKEVCERMIIYCIDLSNLLLDVHNEVVDEDLSAKNLACLWQALDSLRRAENALRAYFITQQEVNYDKE